MPMRDGLPTVGLRIRHARRELRKLTQPQLAAAAGIKQPSLSELETGETKEISGPTLMAVAKALRVRPEWLLTGELPIERSAADDLAQDELELLANYRAAAPRWKVSIRYMAALRGDQAQDEAAGSMNIVLAKIAATPVADYRVEQAYGKAPHVAEAPPPHELRRVTDSTPSAKSGREAKAPARKTRKG